MWKITSSSIKWLKLSLTMHRKSLLNDSSWACRVWATWHGLKCMVTWWCCLVTAVMPFFAMVKQIIWHRDGWGLSPWLLQADEQVSFWPCLPYRAAEEGLVSTTVNVAHFETRIEEENYSIHYFIGPLHGTDTQDKGTFYFTCCLWASPAFIARKKLLLTQCHCCGLKEWGEDVSVSTRAHKRIYIHGEVVC